MALGKRALRQLIETFARFASASQLTSRVALTIYAMGWLSLLTLVKSLWVSYEIEESGVHHHERARVRLAV